MLAATEFVCEGTHIKSSSSDGISTTSWSGSSRILRAGPSLLTLRLLVDTFGNRRTDKLR